MISDQPFDVFAENGFMEGIDFVWDKLPRGTEQGNRSC